MLRILFSKAQPGSRASLSSLWIFIAAALFFAVLPANAQIVDRFPNDSDVTAENAAEQSINQAQQNWALGQSIGADYASDGGKFNSGSGKYQTHPWRGTLGRNPVESYLEWFLDSKYVVGLGEGTSLPSLDDFKTFMECIEPRLVLPICPMFCWPMAERFDGSFTSCPVRDNHGYIFAYWWPEQVIELNNFGTYALNPILFGRVDLMEPIVTTILQPLLEPFTDVALTIKGGSHPSPSFPSGLRSDPHIGQTHHAGLLPGDQTLVTEAHVARTYVAKRTSEQRDPNEGELDFIWKKKKFICIPIFFWYNGYKKGNDKCWYTTHPEDGDVIHAYTESPIFAFYWRFPEMSALLNQDFYFASVPVAVGGSPVGMITPQGLTLIGSYVQMRSCASYRAERWQNRYEDLEDAFWSPFNPIPGIIGDDSLQHRDRICYYGGGSLFPPTGQMMGHFSPLPSAAYFARRALYLAAHVNNSNPTNIFSDRADKLQRVFPEPGECFRVNEIDEYNPGLFPKDAVRPDQLGSIRYIHWNMRVGCVCQYRGGYPIPFLPSILWPFPIGQGCHNWWLEDDESMGNEEHQGIQGLFDPLPPWPYFWPLLPVPYTEAAIQLYPYLL